MAYYPIAIETGAIYTLTNGVWTAVFNDPSDPNYVGMLTEVTGLDAAEVRENSNDLVESDGGVHGSFYMGRRPIVLNGKVFGHATVAARAARLDKARNASLALRSDATLSWNSSTYQFRSAMLTTIPDLWWRLSEASGTAAADSSGNARNGVYAGGVTLNQPGSGVDGSQSVLLDGVDDRVTSTYNPFAQNSTRTFSAWVNRRTTTGYDVVFGGDSSTAPYFRHDSGTNGLQWIPNPASGGVTWANAATPNAWHHIVLVYNDATGAASLYVDGVFISTQTPAGRYPAAPGNIQAGSRHNAVTDPFDGYIEDVAVWTRALTATEIANLYAQAGVGLPRLWVPVRRQQPFRESGQWVKEFQIPLVSQYSQMFGWSLKTTATTAAGTGVTIENQGNFPAYPILRITGVSGNTTTVTDGHGGTFKTLNTLSLASGEVVEFDMLNHTGVFTVGGRIGQSATRYIDFSNITQWPSVVTGNNTFTLASGAAGSLNVIFRDTWA